MTHGLLRKIIINDGTAEVVIFLQVLKVNDKTITYITIMIC